MARINRADVIQKAVNDLALSTSSDFIPNETLDKVQLVYSLNRQFSNFVASTSATATGTATLTLPTIDSRSEIYLTSITADYVKDATCDQATGNLTIKVTPDQQGITRDIIIFAQLTLTAQTGHADISLPFPLKLKPNTNITWASSFTVGNLIKTMACTGFVTTTN